MTTHEMARQLLALPNISLVIEGFCDPGGYVPIARITEYDSGTAIIVNRPASELPSPVVHCQPKYDWYTETYYTACDVDRSTVQCAEDPNQVTCPQCIAKRK